MADGFGIQVTRVQTRSTEVFLSGVERLYGETSHIGGENFAWDVEVARLGPLTLVQGQVDENPMRATISFRDHFVAMTRAAHYELHAGSHLLHTTPGEHAVVISSGQTIEAISPAGMRSLNLGFDPAFVVAQLEALTGEPVHDRFSFDSGLDLHRGVGAYLFQTCQYIADTLHHDQGQLPPLLAASLCESLVRALLTSNVHSHVHLMNSPPPPSSRTIVRRVEEYIDANVGAPIVGSHLAEVAGASVASIESSFQQHRGMSPHAFLRRRRLERAREALSRDPLLSTARAGQMAGYLGVEAFEAAYYKAFGETPAQTRQRAPLAKRPLLTPAPAEHPAHRIALLSPREHEVGNLVARGLLNKQIAGALGISEKMVQKHRGRAMQKLGLASAAELARLWERIGERTGK